MVEKIELGSFSASNAGRVKQIDSSDGEFVVEQLIMIKSCACLQNQQRLVLPVSMMKCSHRIQSVIVWLFRFSKDTQGEKFFRLKDYSQVVRLCLLSKGIRTKAHMDSRTL